MHLTKGIEAITNDLRAVIAARPGLSETDVWSDFRERRRGASVALVNDCKDALVSSGEVVEFETRSERGFKSARFYVAEEAAAQLLADERRRLWQLHLELVERGTSRWLGKEIGRVSRFVAALEDSIEAEYGSPAFPGKVL